jgi:hypothetical protein
MHYGKGETYADSLFLSAFFCKLNQSHVEYNYPMIKVEWVRAAGFLLISSNV